MRRLLLLPLLVVSLARAETIEALVRDGLANNPELAFYERQIAALPKPIGEPPAIPQPLDFPGSEALRAAVRDLDTPLARLHLAQFRFILASELRLKALEYQSATETARCASTLATRTTALVRMLESRPAAGNAALVERRILEGAALPFSADAAQAQLSADQLRIELNGLLGRKPDAPITIEDAFQLPQSAGSPEPQTLARALRIAEIDRGLASSNAAAGIEAFVVAPWFTRDESAPASGGFSRPAGIGSTTPAQQRAQLIEDAESKILREIRRRETSAAAARAVAAAIPRDLVPNLLAAADLADRQYRFGAIPLTLVLEANRESLDALRSSNAAFLRAWRTHLDLALLTLRSTPSQP